jgi:hypothetical protein
MTPARQSHSPTSPGSADVPTNVTQITVQIACQPCRRLIATGCLPARGGQPTQILLHLTLEQLRGLPGASAAEAAWAGPVAGPGADCDATIIPVVTGHIDPVLLDHLAITLLHAAHPADAGPARDRALCAARQMILAAAADLLSGPGGLAAYLMGT